MNGVLYLTDYEILLDAADIQNVTVDETSHFCGTRIKGLYLDNHIAINKDLDSDIQKKCILAEELGHYHTTVGDIMDQSSDANRKQELRARLWGYNKLVGLHGIISGYKAGCQSAYDLAEHLGVTEEFLLEALQCYRSKYGVYTRFDNYAIYFEPTLSVLELI